MNDDTCILLLDDDPVHLAELRRYLRSVGFNVIACLSVEEAERALVNRPDFAIVDLFLAGEDGAELSNTFIQERLIPAKIPYARMTSAPKLVPASLCGAWVMHKREFWDSPDDLAPLLFAALSHSS